METLNLSLALPPALPSHPMTTVEFNDCDLAVMYVMYKVLVYKYLSSAQLKRLFWPHAEHQAAAKRLTQLGISFALDVAEGHAWSGS
jgi:hypothetical protein